ncbi:MAG: branched-chain amino acid transport system II carrier protein [Bacteroidota bacterium]
MNKKSTLIVAFALFSLFFGAGNLILPPQLGFKSGELWWLVALGFSLSAVLIPILGILAHAKLQGTLFDFGKKVSPTFSLIYCYLVYTISISLPSPRTASVTHEMAIQPLFDSSSWLTSGVYFLLVFIFVMNRSRILDIIGKILTPAMVLVLVSIISIAAVTLGAPNGISSFPSPFTHAILEGYQTFDAIGSVVVGGVIIISLNLKHPTVGYTEKKQTIAQAGMLAGLGLFLVYGGLIYAGALHQNVFDADISRTQLLQSISLSTLGNIANAFLTVLVSIACFTTAVGIVTGTADFVKGRFQDSNTAYLITAILGCVLGVLMGQFNVGYIIQVALPALMFIYPVTIALILLNILPEKYATPKVFRSVVFTTLLFSIPDFMNTLGFGEITQTYFSWILLVEFHMGWVLPALVVFLGAILLEKKQVQI